MDTESPMFIAYATAILSSVLAWVYAQYVLKERRADKVFAKTLVASLVAATLVIVVISNSQPKPSLQSEPFFAPLM